MGSHAAIHRSLVRFLTQGTRSELCTSDRGGNRLDRLGRPAFTEGAQKTKRRRGIPAAPSNLMMSVLTCRSEGFSLVPAPPAASSPRGSSTLD
jgi:hypothetical protein